MDELKFLQWLTKKKKIGERSAKDVLCRLNRTKKFLQTDEIEINSLNQLYSINEFLECSTSVKSQLRRAVRLYIEFSNGSEKN